MVFRSALLAALSGIMISGCTSINVDPCSREGIELRIDRTMKSFARSNRSEINDLKSAASWIDGQSTYGAMKLAFAVRSLRELVDDFQSDVVPELETIALECRTEEHLEDLFIDFLDDEGVKDEVLEWVKAFRFVFDA